ncbi:MAG: hypothetical protein R3Y08_06860 [Rikenellaceae bacterium]
MDEDEEMFRLMNEEDDFYMGDRDDPDDDYEQQHRQPNQSGGGMGCLVILPFVAGALTFVVFLIL